MNLLFNCDRPTNPGQYLCSRFHFGEYWQPEFVKISIDPDDQELMYHGCLTNTSLDRIEKEALWWGPIELESQDLIRKPYYEHS